MVILHDLAWFINWNGMSCRWLYYVGNWCSLQETHIYAIYYWLKVKACISTTNAGKYKMVLWEWKSQNWGMMRDPFIDLHTAILAGVMDIFYNSILWSMVYKHEWSVVFHSGYSDILSGSSPHGWVVHIVVASVFENSCASCIMHRCIIARCNSSARILFQPQWLLLCSHLVRTN